MGQLIQSGESIRSNASGHLTAECLQVIYSL